MLLLLLLLLPEKYKENFDVSSEGPSVGAHFVGGYTNFPDEELETLVFVFFM
jgi:hypothetical protein